MKIAIVLNTSWNIFNFRLGLIKALQEQGHHVYAIAPKDGYSDLLTRYGCTYERVRMDSRGASPLKDLGLIWELYTIYKRTKPDVICHFTIKPNIYGTIAANMLKIPVINNVCGLGTVFIEKNTVSKIAMLLYRFAFRFPKKVFFQNNEDLSLFVNKRLINKEISEVIPGSGINLNEFVPVPAKTNKEFTFLLVSRLIRDKGILEYIEAIEKLKREGIKAKFQLLGPTDELHKRGISEKTVSKWIDNKTVDYLGATRDVKPYINAADCIVLPSYREGTPRILLEAASLSKPIISTNVPGCANVVSHNYNGFLCKAKDSDDLAAKMKKMISITNEKRMRMGKNGRLKIEDRFDEKFVIDSYLKAIESPSFK